MPDVCPECDTTVSDDDHHCPECGASLTGESNDGETLAALTHVLGFVTWIFGPLIVLVVSDNAFVTQNAKNALMWQLMLTVYTFISLLLILILVGFLLLAVLAFLDLIFCIIAAIKASEGEAWKYPMTPSV